MNFKPQDTPRMLLAQVRKGDYAHPGDEEAIDLLLSKIANVAPHSLSNAKVLDAGCGLGGTANYIQNKLAADVVGIDIDSAAIAYAKASYPNINFFEGDILAIPPIVSEEKFQLIYMFNVIYGIKDKSLCLENLAKIATPDAILAIFDYAKTDDSEFKMRDLVRNPIYPLEMSKLEKLFSESGWKLEEVIDISDAYLRWYEAFLQKFAKKKDQLLQQFSANTYNQVFDTFSALLTHLNNHSLSGVIVLGRSKHYS